MRVTGAILANASVSRLLSTPPKLHSVISHIMVSNLMTLVQLRRIAQAIEWFEW